MANMISNIFLCNVDFTPVNQRFFDTREIQLAYMQKNVKHIYNNCNYVARSGTLDIKGNIHNLSDVNYGYYINDYQGVTQTFFFWIVSREALSKNSTRLTIQLDVIQTWCFDWDFLPCMVEREHVYDDRKYRNTYPEDFEIGDYIHRNVTPTGYFNDDVVYILAESGESGIKIGGLYNACRFLLADSIGGLNDYIQSKANEGKADAISYIFSYPKKFLKLIANLDNIHQEADGGMFDLSDPTYVDITQAIKKDIKIQDNISKFKQPQYTWEYEPYNNKLYNYPYNFITIMTPHGNNSVLKYELFNNDVQSQGVDLQIIGTVTQDPKFLLVPKNYNGRELSMQDAVELGGFGLCSWNNDNYANWYAQNSMVIRAQSENARNTMNTQAQVNRQSYENAQYQREANLRKGEINSVAQLGGILSNPVGSVVGAVQTGANAYIDYSAQGFSADTDLSNKNLLNTATYHNEMRSLLASVESHSIVPNTARGDLTANGLDICTKQNDFYICHTQIKSEFAYKIDMYFQMFGYQINEIKKPSACFYNRKKWVFIKTVGCDIVDQKNNGIVIPREDKQAIAEVFDNGIRLWHTTDINQDIQIGNYDRKNPQ